MQLVLSNNAKGPCFNAPALNPSQWIYVTSLIFKEPSQAIGYSLFFPNIKMPKIIYSL